MDSRTIRFVLSSEVRLKILTELGARPVTPSEIVSSLNKHFSQVSRALRELREKELVVYKGKESRREKQYTLTANGAQVLQEIRRATMLV